MKILAIAAAILLQASCPPGGIKLGLLNYCRLEYSEQLVWTVRVAKGIYFLSGSR